MALLKKRLPGSTLVETLVASILFLVIFFLALDTLSRVGVRVPDDTLPAVETDLQACLHEFSTGDAAPGDYLRVYEWGEIAIAVRGYGELTDVRRLELVCRIDRHRSLVFHRLIPVGE
jgi:hypothetical protein